MRPELVIVSPLLRLYTQCPDNLGVFSLAGGNEIFFHHESGLKRLVSSHVGADQQLEMTCGDPLAFLGVLFLSPSLSSLGLALKTQLPVPSWSPAPSSFHEDSASHLVTSPCTMAWKLSGATVGTTS